ncbi:MAG: hypothetical protein AVDCRST_MAG85-4270 [uncultured Solirubrobacteraceae bacterium]|uniref:Uncharacterized protein n=1 Tax=uncultured Solirubrobacteraceae bacterium TaxID=1162706 RepID=A0A6J4U2D8_9ACTN|nr:MAG: hypothetical protein AVDCRST_MAG85-4270 [uncultured Solirubrobacteraceae bacterium]
MVGVLVASVLAGGAIATSPLPTIVFFAWVVPLFTGGLGHVATVSGIAAGVIGAVVIVKTRHLGRTLCPAKLAATSSGA